MDGAFPSQKGQSFENMPGDGYGRGRGFRGTAENSKTKLCSRWQQGDCRFGDRCNFAHGEHELRTLPPRDFEGGPMGSAPGRGAPVSRGRAPAYGYGRGPSGPSPGYGRGRAYDGYPQGRGYAGGYHQAPYNSGYGIEHGAPGGGYSDSRGGHGGGGGGWEQQGQTFNAPMAGPNGWTAYRSAEGEIYFHNPRTNITQWDAPAEWRNPPK